MDTWAWVRVQCHESCVSCGYQIDDRSEGFTLGGPATVPHDRGHNPDGRNDCVSCRPGLYLNVLELHGTGFCSRTACMMFCADVPDGYVWASGVQVSFLPLPFLRYRRVKIQGRGRVGDRSTVPLLLKL